MLGLTRKEGESVTIRTPEGRTITIVIGLLRISRVRLLLKADPEVEILRTELLTPEPKPAERTSR